MSFEDLEVARAARAAKDVVKGKSKRGRKRNSAALDEGEPEPVLEPRPELEPEPGVIPEPEMAHAAKNDKKNTRKRAREHASTANAAQPESAPELEPELEPELVSELARIVIPPETWRAPVATMY